MLTPASLGSRDNAAPCKEPSLFQTPDVAEGQVAKFWFGRGPSRAVPQPLFYCGEIPSGLPAPRPPQPPLRLLLPTGRAWPLGQDAQRQAGLAETFTVLTGRQSQYIVSRTKTRGSFGKVRWGQSLDGSSERLAIKEYRRHDKAGEDALWRARKTWGTAAAEVLREFERTQRVREIFAQSLPDLIAQSYPGGLSAWRGVVPHTRPSRAVELVWDDFHVSRRTGRVEPKCYFISSLDDTDLHHLLRSWTQTRRQPTDGASRRCLARSFLFQGLLQLAALHEQARLFHGDINSANIFVTAEGECRLADFGMAAGLGMGNCSRRQGPHGSLVTPEMFDLGFADTNPGNDRPAGLAKKTPGLGPATDVMALWWVAFEILAGDWRTREQRRAGASYIHPFHAMRWTSEQGACENYNEAAETLRAYYRFVDQLPRYAGQPRARLVKNPTPAALASGQPVLDRFLAAALVTDPELVDLGVRIGTTYSPAQRSSARLQAHEVGSLLGVTFASERVALRERLAGLCYDASREACFAAQQQYRTLVERGG